MSAEEATIDFVDTHVHLWDHSVPALEWTWMKSNADQGAGRGTHEVDAPSYTPLEFADETRGAGVSAFVAVHSATLESDPLAETAWFERLARNHPALGGAVGFCCLSAPDAVDVLNGHATVPVVRGVRDLTVSQGLEIDAVAPAMAAATALGLSVEMRTSLEQFPVMRALAERWPEVSIVLSHAGLPRGRTIETLGPWSSAMAHLAEAPNVVCKISAVASASDPDWSVDSIRPWILGCIEAFGPARCMFATNWPFDRPWANYLNLVAAYREIVSAFSHDERAAILHGTAELTYRLA